jgi:hypothetical protein
MERTTKRYGMRTVDITLINMKDDDVRNLEFAFESVEDLVQKIDRVIEDLEWKKATVELVDDSVFTEEEINYLSENDIY